MQSADFLKALFEFVVLIFSLCVHEAAHAWMASRLGDQTARLQGRITLNPVYHVDPIGTLLFPALMIFGPFMGMSFFGGMLVGWAKPTPVITRNFRKIVRDDNFTTLAGPVSNLLLVALAYGGLLLAGRLLPDGGPLVVNSFVASLSRGGAANVHPLVLLCSLTILINLSLFFFNLLPIPPLDGSRVLRNMLPYRLLQGYDRIGGWISYLLMIFVGGYVLQLLLGPALQLIYFGLIHSQG